MFEARPIQTKVKHIILERYLKAWGGIIINGSRYGIQKARQKGVQNAGLHFIYVDCFAGCGQYMGELEDQEKGLPLTPVSGSPIIGIEALDGLVEYGSKEGVPVRVTTILIESSANNYNSLKSLLIEKGLSDRIHESIDFANLPNKGIALVHNDSTNLADNLLSYTKSSNYTYAFYLLDPWGPTGIPLRIVRRIISQKKHDVLINMPYQDLHKKSGIVGKQQLSSTEVNLLRNYDEMFGNQNWHSIVQNWQESEAASRQAGELELELANYYRNVLYNADNQLSVKSIPLRFPDRDRTMFHLYLTTHDPNGALQMNQIMLDAGYAERHLRWQLQYLKKTHGGRQLGLFNPTQIAPELNPSERDYTDEIAQKIQNRFSGRSTNRRQIYQYLADELYLPGEINQALSKLKREKKARFDGSPSGLKNDTIIVIYQSS